MALIGDYRPVKRRSFLKTAAGALTLAGAAQSLAQPADPAPKLEAMIGQLLVCGLPANSADDESAQLLAMQIAEGKVGGSVLLRHNIKDRESVLGLTDLFVRASPQVLNAVDQEGGLVQRLSKDTGFFRLPRAQWVAEHLSEEQAEELYFEAGEELRRAQFNLNLAPSVDWYDPENPVIGKFGRSFGATEATIERYAHRFVAGMQRAGLATTLKHFPGHGTSRGDSHNGFVDISSTWNEQELLPFEYLAPEAALIMGGHLVHPEFSEGDLPITFSSKALELVLRQRLQFKGVIITDDLDMGAIRKSYALEDAVIRSIQAGNDLLLMSNSLEYDSQLPDKVVSWVMKALDQNRLSEARLAAAYERVMGLKRRYAFEVANW